MGERESLTPRLVRLSFSLLLLLNTDVAFGRALGYTGYDWQHWSNRM